MSHLFYVSWKLHDIFFLLNFPTACRDMHYNADQTVAEVSYTLYLLCSVKLSAFKDLRARIRIFTGCLLSVIKRSRLYFYGLSLVKHFTRVNSSCLIRMNLPRSRGSGQQPITWVWKFSLAEMWPINRCTWLQRGLPSVGHGNPVFVFWVDRWRLGRLV